VKPAGLVLRKVCGRPSARERKAVAGSTKGGDGWIRCGKAVASNRERHKLTHKWQTE